MKNIQGIVARVAELYAWVDQAIQAQETTGPSCRACGQCCDFSAYDHRLFVTTPELIYFQLRLAEPVKFMTTGRCPYQVQEKCSVYKIRFLGCRIFGCERSLSLQAELTETALQRIRDLCEEFDFAYRYVDLATALNLAAPAKASGAGQATGQAKAGPQSSTKEHPPPTK
jgi:Fe-S-cluster containining protein